MRGSNIGCQAVLGVKQWEEAELDEALRQLYCKLRPLLCLGL